MNVDGGYWVLGLQMEAIERADRAELPVDDWAIALASDGFLRLTDMFGRLGVSDLLSINSREEFEEYYSQLRTLEQVDGSLRSEEHTSELQSLMRISYAVFCLKKKKTD